MKIFVYIILLILVVCLTSFCGAFGHRGGWRQVDYNYYDGELRSRRLGHRGGAGRSGDSNGNRRSGWGNYDYGWKGYDRLRNDPNNNSAWSNDWRYSLANLFFGKSY